MSELKEISEYSAVASYSGSKGQVEAESEKMVVKPNEIHLNFMRYIIAKDDTNYFIYPKKETSSSLNPKDAPSITGYSYKASQVREGYVYICFKDKPDLFKEFIVDECGKLTNLVNDLQEDVRPNTEGKSEKYYSLRANTGVIWVGFSEFQWSAKYIDKIRNDSALRSKRMQEFDTTKWTTTDQEHAYNIDKIEGFVQLDQGDKAPHETPEKVWSPGILQEPNNYGSTSKWKALYDQAKVQDTEPSEYKEVFLCLDDPFRCADELSRLISDESIKLQTLVTKTEGAEDLNSNHFYLQMHTMAMYRLFYSEKRNKDMDGLADNIVSREFLEKLLATTDRKVLRDKINGLRQVLLQFIDSDYYRTPIGDIESLTNDILLQAQLAVNIHQLTAAKCPSECDRHLDLKHDTKCRNIDKEVQDYIKITLEESHPIYKMYTNEVDSDFVSNFEDIPKNLMTLLTSLKDDNIGKIKTISKNLLGKYFIGTRLTAGERMPILTVGKSNFESIIRALDIKPEKIKFYSGSGRLGMTNISTNNLKITEVDDCFVLNTPKTAIGKTALSFDRFTKSNSFLALSAFVAVYNMGHTIKNRESGLLNIARQVSNTLALIAEVGAYTMTYMEKRTTVVETARKLRIGGQLASAAAIGISSVLSIIDGIEASSRKDHDSALASYASGTAFLIAAAFSIKAAMAGGASITAFAIGAVKFSYATIFIVIGMAALYLAMYLKDSPLEYYLKHFILSENANGKRGWFSRNLYEWENLSTIELIEKIIKHKGDIVDSESWKEWQNLRTSYEEYLSLNCIAEVTEVTYDKYESEGFTGVGKLLTPMSRQHPPDTINDRQLCH